jgi:predicted nucleic acid-binding Zn ribbon protein|tara:strand:+ start:371 stop:661 length:291 start_codon:yes stop_codon:yes gene_type:complete
MRKSNSHTLKELIEVIINKGRLRSGMQEFNIQKSWEEIVGENIAGHTTRIALRGNTLYVNLDSSVLRQELGFGKEFITKKVNEKLGKSVVEKLVFN